MAFKTICVDHVGIACAGTLEEAAKIYQEDHQAVTSCFAPTSLRSGLFFREMVL